MKIEILRSKMHRATITEANLNYNDYAIRTELGLILAKITIIADRVFVIKTIKEPIWINTFGDKNSVWLKKYLQKMCGRSISCFLGFYNGHQAIKELKFNLELKKRDKHGV